MPLFDSYSDGLVDFTLVLRTSSNHLIISFWNAYSQSYCNVAPLYGGNMIDGAKGLMIVLA